MKIYYHPHVRLIRELHEEIIHDRKRYRTVAEQLLLFADNLLQAHREGDSKAAFELGRFHPEFSEKSDREILEGAVSIADCRLAVARGYDYEDWRDVTDRGQLEFAEPFEQCLDYLLSGDRAGLGAMLRQHPGVLSAHSPYLHRAGIIHYIAANGVELWRQMVPENLPELADLLLEAGADPRQRHQIYGGTGSLVQLLETSAHPFEAGVGEKLKRLVS